MSKKNIKIILIQDIDNIGHKGTVKNVALGYARNYLLPKGLAALVTNKIEIELQKTIANEEANNIKILQKAIHLKENLATINTLTLKKKVGSNNVIFGSVTDKEIIDLLLKAIGEIIDKKYIEIPNIKTIGLYTINIKLHKDITQEVSLQVIPDENN
uniref:Large ribosomal subunit protein bL9c n=1 Tax=Compsopogon caeruleus TaxID=31354 RepID=A0A1Z1XAZ7_9RHOD|nr:50S ribosomal protein L9 [Compsopogon caeruleus]ARX96029.1 50S ribosomal protein L9 [Compsopogon caeruleus]